MADAGPPAGPQDWPNERLKILIPTWILCIISTGFVLWRIVYGLMQKRKFMTADYLLIIATVCILSDHLSLLSVDHCPTVLM